MKGLVGKTLRAVTGTVAIGSTATVSAYLLTTHQTKIVTLPSDHVPTIPIFARLNPRKNPVTADRAIRRIPLHALPISLQDHVRNGDGHELTRRFCAGIWSSAGYEIQRRYLEKKYRSLTDRQSQLWERLDLLTSEYPIGTIITDHFEVVENQSDRITVRCGDTPMNGSVRASDGLFSMQTQYLPESNEVEFVLYSVFWNGLADRITQKSGPMPTHIEFLHRVYTKLWMESSVRTLVA